MGPLSRRAALILVLFCAAASCGESEPELRVLDGIEVTYVITPRIAPEIADSLGDAFEVVGDTIVLPTRDSLVELARASGAIEVTAITSGVPPESFAADQGMLLVVKNQFLGLLEEGGYSQAIALPTEGMRLAPSANPGTVYLYGPAGASSSRLYAFYEDGVLDIILELPRPIRAVTDNGHAIYVATDREILRVTPRGYSLVIRLPQEEPVIVSLVAAADDRTLFVSSKDRVTAITGVAGIPIVLNAGGALRLIGPQLYLWDAKRNVLAILGNLDDALKRRT